MPITLTAPEGLLSPEAQAQVFAGLTDALLEVAGLSGNAFMTANTIGTINVLPKERILAGGKPVGGVFIELKLPEIALATAEAKRAFVEKATDIVERAAQGRLSVSTSSMCPKGHGASRGAATATPILLTRSRARRPSDLVSLAARAGPPVT